MSTLKEKYIGESSLSEKPDKKLILKINDGAVTPEHLSPRVKDEVIAPLIENAKEEIINEIGGQSVSSEEIKIIEVEGRSRTDSDPIYPGMNNMYFYTFKDPITPEELADYIKNYKFVYLHITDPDLGDSLCSYMPSFSSLVGGIAFVESGTFGTLNSEIIAYVINYDSGTWKIQQYQVHSSINSNNYVNTYGDWSSTGLAYRGIRGIELVADHVDSVAGELVATPECSKVKIGQVGVAVTTKEVDGEYLPFTWNGNKVLVENDCYTKAEVDAMLAALRSEFFES